MISHVTAATKPITYWLYFVFIMFVETRWTKFNFFKMVVLRAYDEKK